MNCFTIVEGDLRPAQILYLKANGKPFDLTGATSVEFIFKSGGTRRSGQATVLDARQGKIRYDWVDGDTDLPGDYACIVVVTIDDKEQTFPNGGVGTFKIAKRL
jgi:hypothetical protein